MTMSSGTILRSSASLSLASRLVEEVPVREKQTKIIASNQLILADKTYSCVHRTIRLDQQDCTHQLVLAMLM